MDQVFTLAWESLLQGLGVFVRGVLLLGALTSVGRELAGGLWMLGWTALLLTAGFFLAADAGYPFTRHVAFVAVGLFPPLMLMGAIELHPRRSAPHWPLGVGVAAGLARVALMETGFPLACAIMCAVLGPAFLFGAARYVWTAPAAVQYRRVIGGLFIALAAERRNPSSFPWRRRTERASISSAPFRTTRSPAKPACS